MAEAGLKSKGWHLTTEGITLCNQGNSNAGNKILVDKIIEAAKDIDLREIGEKSLPEDVNRGKCEYVEGPVILQVQKIRNVSAPKENEESQSAPRMLRMTLTDGHVNCNAVEMERLDKLGLHTPPGTKICVKGTVEVEHGFLLLTNKNTVFVGGRVEKLAENWELKKMLAKQSRGNVGQEGGPPPFVPFGQRIRENKSAVRTNKRDNFKSLQEKDKDKKTEDGEFQQQRQATIAEALQAKEDGKTKTFGGQKQIGQDRDLSRIVEMGFSAEVASRVLRDCNGNVNMAINRLISGDVHGGSYSRESRQTDSRDFRRDDKRPPLKEDKRENMRGRGRRGKEEEDTVTESVSSKPSGPATLFDFLETKIKPSAEDKGNKQDQNVPSSRNGYSSSHSNDHSKSANQYQQDRQYSNRSERGDNSSRDYNRYDNRPQSGPARGSYSNQDSRYEKKSYQNNYSNSSDRNFESERRNQRQNYNSDRRKTDSGKQYSNEENVRNRENQDYRSQNRPKSSHNSYNPRQEGRNENARNFDRQYSNKDRGDNSQSVATKSDTYQHQQSSRRTQDSHQQNSSYNVRNDNKQYGTQSDRSQYNDGQQSSGRHQDRQPRDSTKNKQKNFQGTAQSTEPGPPLPNLSVPPPPMWKSGDKCLAKYWEDGKFYHAVITNIRPGLPTCIVLFTAYGNEEEVSFSDIQPTKNMQDDYSRSQGGQGQNRNQQYLPQSQYQQRLNTDHFSSSSTDQRFQGRGGSSGQGSNYNQNYAARQGQQTNQIESMEFRRRRTEPRQDHGRPTQQLYQPPAHRQSKET